LTWAPAAFARAGYFGGPQFIGGFYGPALYPGFSDPSWWYGPEGGQIYYPGPPAGEVEIVTKHKGNSIYVDGKFAGHTGQLKKFPLRAGTHVIELRNQGGKAIYQERITVISGKKLKIHTDYPGQP
jgi:hypothetical protein